MITKVSNSGRQAILEKFVNDVTSIDNNLYLLYSYDTNGRTIDEVPGIITPGTITQHATKLAVKLSDKIQFAIHNTNIEITAEIAPLVDEVTIGGIDYIIVKDFKTLPQIIKDNANVTGAYWTTLVYNQEIISPADIEYNILTLATNVRDGSNNLYTDAVIRNIPNTNLGKVNIIMQALPRNTTLPKGKTNLPVVVTF